jgi:hypothetical protein
LSSFRGYEPCPPLMRLKSYSLQPMTSSITRS